MLEFLVAILTFAVAFPIVEERIFYSRIVPREMEITATMLVTGIVASIAAAITYLVK